LQNIHELKLFQPITTFPQLMCHVHVVGTLLMTTLKQNNGRTLSYVYDDAYTCSTTICYYRCHYQFFVLKHTFTLKIHLIIIRVAWQQ